MGFEVKATRIILVPGERVSRWQHQAAANVRQLEEAHAVQAEELEGRAHAISRHHNVHWRRQRVHHGVSKTTLERSLQMDGLSSFLAVKPSFNLLAQIRMRDEYAEHFTPLQPARRQAAACPCAQISRGDELAAVAPACSQYQIHKEEHSWPHYRSCAPELLDQRIFNLQLLLSVPVHTDESKDKTL